MSYAIPRVFLERSCGSWSSQRRYLFAPKFQPANMVTNFTMKQTSSNVFQIDWSGQTTGQMVLTLDGLHLHRSRDYFGDGANTSIIEVIDEDCLTMRTEYGGSRYREEVRLIEGDKYRLRQTVGFNLKSGALTLSGQYLETKLTQED